MFQLWLDHHEFGDTGTETSTHAVFSASSQLLRCPSHTSSISADLQLLQQARLGRGCSLSRHMRTCVVEFVLFFPSFWKCLLLWQCILPVKFPLTSLVLLLLLSS